MEVIEAARIFHDWAAIEGLMSEGAAKRVSSTAAELHLIVPRDETAKRILRRRGVTSIMFSDAGREVIVLTKKTKPSKKELALLPVAIDDVCISYRQGAPTSIGEPPRAQSNPPFAIRHVGGIERYACGSSVSQGNSRDAGTLGCLVRDDGGVVYGLSNNHVTGGCSHAKVGLPILAPGVLDVVPVGQDPFTIGYHERALDMIVGTPDNTNTSSNLDAAIFKIVAKGDPVTSFQGSYYDTPATIVDIHAGLEVEKVGRTTRHTRGVVVGEFYGGRPVFYDMDIHAFKGRVFFDPVWAIAGIGGAFSEPGDSGALVTVLDDKQQRHAVGIVIAGMNDKSAPGGILTLVLPIEPILKKLKITLVSGHNV